MAYRYAVLGAGKQGVAIAYDLARRGEAESVEIVDQVGRQAAEGATRVNSLVGRDVVRHRAANLDSARAIGAAIDGCHAVVSALPFFLNLEAARASIAAKAHFTDLGGNTGVVLEELELDAEARRAGVCLQPDCGLAPGLSNLLAAHAIESLDQVETIRARCGGLPTHPKPPFGYKQVFSLDGLINEYSGEAIVVRDGKIAKVRGLDEMESLHVDGVGDLEAAVTTGGTSTGPYSFEGRVRNFDYKTLRYPGHWAAMRAFRDLGLFETERRELFKSMLAPLIADPESRDLVVLTVEAAGTDDGKPATYRAILIDRGDEATGFTAMERTTGFPTTVIAHLQAQGRIAPGAVPIEKAVPLDAFFPALAARGIRIDISH